MSTGLINLVTVGSATITVTHTPTGLTTTVPVTVTSVALDHLKLLLSGSGGVVGGTPPTLTTQKWADAAETTPSTATVNLSYSSSNASVATVNSTTGAITMVAMGSCTFTVTDSISTKTATSSTFTVSVAGSGIMGANGAVPIEYEDPNLYGTETASTPNAAFRSRITSALPVVSNNALKGTGGGSSFYNDGQGFVDLVLVVGGVGPTGGNAFEATFLAQNAGGQTPNPQFIHSIPSAKQPKRMWSARQIQHQAGWSNVGDGDSSAAISWNNTQGQGMKTGPWTASALDNGSRNGSDMAGFQYDAEGGCKYGDTVYGLIDSWMGTVQNEWTDSQWYDELMLIEYITGSDGNPWYIQTEWRKFTTAANSTYVRVGPKLTAPLTGAPTPGGQERMGVWQWTCKNYNQSRKTTLVRRHGVSAWWDADNPNNDGSNDPFTVFPLDAAHAPTAPISTALVSKAGNNVTFDVKLTNDYPSKDASYAKFLRPVIDGTTQTGVDVTVPYEQSESWCERGPVDTGPTANLCRVTITVANGTHTVGFKAVNGAGTLVSAASSTASVTVP